MSERASRHHSRSRRPRLETRGYHREAEESKRRFSFAVPGRMHKLLAGLCMIDSEVSGTEVSLSDELGRAVDEYVAFRTLDPEMPEEIKTPTQGLREETPSFHPPDFNPWIKLNWDIPETTLSALRRLQHYDSTRVPEVTVGSLMVDAIGSYLLQRRLDPDFPGQLLAARLKHDLAAHPDAPPDIVQ